MSRDVAQVFADIDSLNPDAFVAHLTEDVVFRFGNADPVTGRAAVREAVSGSSRRSTGSPTTSGTRGSSVTRPSCRSTSSMPARTARR